MDPLKGYADRGGQDRPMRNPNLVGLWVLLAVGLVVVALVALLA